MKDGPHLVLEYADPFPNCLCIRVVTMPEWMRGKELIFQTTEVLIVSQCSPQAIQGSQGQPHTLYICGQRPELDDLPMVLAFNDAEEKKLFLRDIHKAVSALNTSIDIGDVPSEGDLALEHGVLLTQYQAETLLDLLPETEPFDDIREFLTMRLTKTGLRQEPLIQRIEF
jgi:hypothetical protein